MGRKGDISIRADPEKGRFRFLVLTSWKFYVADEEDSQRGRKRGGGTVVPLDFSSGEELYQREPAHSNVAASVRPGLPSPRAEFD